MQKYLKFITQICFGLAIVSLPFQVHTIVYEASAYSSGMFLPYTAFFLYISDIFFCGAFFGFLLQCLLEKRLPSLGKKWVFGGLIGMLFFTELSIFFAKDQVLVLWHVLRVLEYIGVYLLVVNRIIDHEKIIFLLASSLSVQVGVGLFQVIFQMPIGIHFFGEPYLSPEALGIAKLEVFDLKLVRAYGTFAHPNVFSGVLVVVFFLLGFQKKSHANGILRAIFLLGMAITFSRAVWLSLIMGIVFYVLFLKKLNYKKHEYWKRTGIMLLIVMITYIIVPFQLIFGSSVSERLNYLSISSAMILDNLFGVGSGNFTLFMQSYTSEKLLPWEFQPVHNVFFLISSELGILAGIAALIFVFGVGYLLWQKRYYKEGKLLLMTLVALGIVLFQVDHYFWDIYTAQMVLWIYFGFVGSFLYQKGPLTQLKMKLKVEERKKR